MTYGPKMRLRLSEGDGGMDIYGVREDFGYTQRHFYAAGVTVACATGDLGRDEGNVGTINFELAIFFHILFDAGASP